MKTNWRPLLVCSGLLLLAQVNRCLSAGAAAALPAPFPLLVPDSKSKVTIVFCYCPPGALSPGRPKVGSTKNDDAKIAMQPMAGFWMGQTEVTFAQYQALMGSDAVSALIRRLKTQRAQMTTEDEVKYLVRILGRLIMELEKQQIAGEKVNEPVFAVTIEDAVAYCKEVNKRLSTERAEYERKQNWIALMEERSVRLPTSWEWQYACGAGQVSVHFPHHPGKKPVEFKSLNEVNQRDCLLVWSAAKLPGENTELAWTNLTPAQFQERLLALTVAPLESNSKPAEVLERILLQLAKDCYGWPKCGIGVTLDRYSCAVEAKAGTANAWGIRGMLDNVTEWVLWQEEHDDPAKNIDAVITWKMLMATQPAEASTLLRTAPRLFLAGGSWTAGYQGTHLLQRTVWGGPVLVNGEPSGLHYLIEKMDGDKNLLHKAPGFRVILQRHLIDNWLVQTQRAWIGKPEAEAIEQLDKAREKIKSLVPNNDSKREKSLAILDYHEAQAKKADLKLVTENLVKKKVIDENDKLFLDFTGK